MQHLRLRIKIALIIGVLVVTAFVIAGVGIMQLRGLNARLQGLVDVTVHEHALASQMQIDLLQAIRKEKNSIISVKDADCKAFADQARKSHESVNQSRTEVKKLIEQHGSAEEKEALAEFDLSWREFLARESEALDLAVKNTNVHASELHSGKMTDKGNQIEEALTSVMAQADVEINQKPDPVRVTAMYKKSRQIGDVIIQVKIMQRLLKRHNDLSDDQEMTALETQIKSTESGIDALLATLKTQATDKEIAAFDRAVAAFSELKELAKQMLKLSREDTNNKSSAMSLGIVRDLAEACNNALVRLKNSFDLRLEADKLASQNAYTNSLWLTIASALIGVALSLVLSVFVTRSITHPLTQTVDLARAIASGDLSQRLRMNRRDEIGDLAVALDKMADGLQAQQKNIAQTAQAVAGAAQELTAVSQQMSANAEETAAQANVSSAAATQVSQNVASVATGSEEMSASIREIAKSANEAARVATAAVSVAERTNVAVQSVRRV
jgi:methyl-accepting chemotaxis protein